MDCLSAAVERPTEGVGCAVVRRARKPVGGFRFVSVFQITMVWWAYREGFIQYRDLRVWFACQELVARRCRLKPDELARYTLDELHGLVGGAGGRHLRASMRRLQNIGLITGSESTITFAESPDELRVDDLTGFWAMLEAMGQRNRKIAVPRRTIRLIAGGARRAVTACMLGQLIRCMYYRRGECAAEGCCKASWIADVFGVSVRHVKAARAHLRNIGWLIPLDSEHWHRQRWGGRGVINLAWSRPVATTDDVIETSPRPTENDTETSPPESDNELSSRLKNQKPARRGPAGVCSEEKSLKKPTMRHIVPEDLSDTGRLVALFETARHEGLVSGSESDRLRFVAVAERARTVGTRNPCGLFVRLVRGELWHHITQDDEDAAQRRLKQYFYGDFEKREPAESPKPPLRVELSNDGRFAAAVQRAVSQGAYCGDPFHLVMREFPEWTRERWGRAIEELENARLRQLGIMSYNRNDDEVSHV